MSIRLNKENGGMLYPRLQTFKNIPKNAFANVFLRSVTTMLIIVCRPENLIVAGIVFRSFQLGFEFGHPVF